MTLHNNGKYEVGYKVLMRKRPVKDVLVFTPPEGTLAPGATQKLEVPTLPPLHATSALRTLRPARRLTPLRLSLACSTGPTPNPTPNPNKPLTRSCSRPYP